MKSENKMLAMAPGRLVWNVSFPLMISLLVQSLYNIVDGIFVSRISLEALSATSIAYPIQMLMIALSVGTGVGLNAFLSKTLGAGKSKEAARISGNGILIALAEWAVFLIFGLFFCPMFVSLYALDSQTAQMAIAYLQICTCVSVGVFTAVIGERCLQATGKTWLSMASQSVGCVVNLVLDPIMIFGMIGFPVLGVRGAAIATVIGQCVSALTALLLNGFMNKAASFGVKDMKPDGKVIKNIFKIGLPTIVMQGCGSFMSMGMNAILIGYSSAQVAFFGAWYKLQSFLYMPLNGLAQGLIPIVGFNMGAGKLDRVKACFSCAMKMAIAFMAIGTVIFWIFPHQLLSLYLDDAQLLSQGVWAMRILSCCFVLTGISVTIGYYFTGRQNGMVNMISTLIRQIVLLLPCAWLLGKLFGLDGIWFSFWIAEGAACLFSVLWNKTHPLQKA